MRVESLAEGDLYRKSRSFDRTTLTVVLGRAAIVRGKKYAESFHQTKVRANMKYSLTLNRTSIMNQNQTV